MGRLYMYIYMNGWSFMVSNVGEYTSRLNHPMVCRDFKNSWNPMVFFFTQPPGAYCVPWTCGFVENSQKVWDEFQWTFFFSQEWPECLDTTDSVSISSPEFTGKRCQILQICPLWHFPKQAATDGTWGSKLISRVRFWLRAKSTTLDVGVPTKSTKQKSFHRIWR